MSRIFVCVVRADHLAVASDCFPPSASLRRLIPHSSGDLPDPRRNAALSLRGHVARANSQWRDFKTGEEALAIFTGPQHYISASWYPGKKIHGREVPTWNYVAVHAYGRLRAVEDTDWLLEHLRTLTDENERTAEFPWKVSDAPPEFIVKLTRAIVGIELDVTRVEGKWKVSQNRTDEDAMAVIAGLDRLGTPASEMMRELVRARRPRESD